MHTQYTNFYTLRTRSSTLLPEVVGASRAYLQCTIEYTSCPGISASCRSRLQRPFGWCRVYESPNSPGHETRVSRGCGLLFIFRALFLPLSPPPTSSVGRKKTPLPPLIPIAKYLRYYSSLFTIPLQSEKPDLQYYARLVAQG